MLRIFLLSVTALSLASCASPDTSSLPEGTVVQVNDKLDCKTSTIKKLPNSGCYIVTGTVTKIYDEDEFLLQDGTGKLDINTHQLAAGKIYLSDKITLAGMIDFPRWKRVVGFRKLMNAIKVTLPNGKVFAHAAAKTTPKA